MHAVDLFSRAASKDRRGQPLAERMRPESMAEYVGQEHLLGSGRWLRRALDSKGLTSLILWGPPGTGKTTLGRLLAAEIGAAFVALSAVMSGVKEVREAVAEAGVRRDTRGERTLLFIDEIHRFNKAQQDALLPHVEAGTVILVGATTENPSFEVNAPLLSRAKVLVLKPLSEADLRTLIDRALADPERGLGRAGVTGPDKAKVLCIPNIDDVVACGERRFCVVARGVVNHDDLVFDFDGVVLDRVKAAQRVAELVVDRDDD